MKIPDSRMTVAPPYAQTDFMVTLTEGMASEHINLHSLDKLTNEFITLEHQSVNSAFYASCVNTHHKLMTSIIHGRYTLLNHQLRFIPHFADQFSVKLFHFTEVIKSTLSSLRYFLSVTLFLCFFRLNHFAFFFALTFTIEVFFQLVGTSSNYDGNANENVADLKI